MQRWNVGKNEFLENKKIDKCIEEVISVLKKHKFSISHEDIHGSFAIEVYNETSIKWLKSANDYT